MNPDTLTPILPAKTVGSIRKKLLAWYDRNHRDLPWRGQPSPYAVLVSEIMLQQTRVEAVIPYYQRWMQSFPTVQSLARARTEQVLEHWAGLGYYRRAHNLHAAAREIDLKYGKSFPNTESDLRQLPGIGRYTAGAILSIAFGQRAPLVDGNVARLFSRLFHWTEIYPSPALEKKLWQAANELVPENRAGDFNQALMEMGATVCTPRSPHCHRCPLTQNCASRQTGDAVQLPHRKAKKAVRTVRAVCLLISHGNEVLLSQRGSDGLWAGLWEPPWQERPIDINVRSATDFFRQRSELAQGRIEALTVLHHGLTHFDLELHAYTVHIETKAKQKNMHWFAVSELVKKNPPVALAAWSKRLFQQLAEHLEGAEND